MERRKKCFPLLYNPTPNFRWIDIDFLISLLFQIRRRWWTVRVLFNASHRIQFEWGRCLFLTRQWRHSPEFKCEFSEPCRCRLLWAPKGTAPATPQRYINEQTKIASETEQIEFSFEFQFSNVGCRVCVKLFHRWRSESMRPRILCKTIFISISFGFMTTNLSVSHIDPDSRARQSHTYQSSDNASAITLSASLSATSWQFLFTCFQLNTMLAMFVSVCTRSTSFHW